MGCFAVSISREESFGDHPESQRYRKLLDGNSLSSVRMDQGLSTAAGAVGNVAGKLRGRLAAVKQQKATQRGLDSGEIKDLSD